ncbi:sister-chromatide cohesion complex Cohesin, subunit SMC1 [Cyanidioschyzon merolae strain 10D]|uniref:Structural maintenance of chromosomes protein n=1 Tax=Cyanidioschyzon merolae (strain NIES-3377 / 10D) TaxID=280699 RepID=M1V7T2_CYAM1|nr:sister-chromatide cohesion complex Cohesin, subunit SMC1 [Cyanidioschyzon merolae strain 10D]BAM80064.1 sister-chromatide cohesion complex Cohesin, subunit SMC1 [Cyanidioschyzon merolae strain 10D]|eukprot:XP_005536350.1 sister-chromatide cohesion complex Cohesin, subunit SMC1 [Cyanidioschyzon merolae strain 10D]
MGRIQRLEVENFKSYGGKVCIGPFVEGFTAVIGPNGVGKSNLLDALGFALGLPARFLRAQRLAELIYRKSDHDVVHGQEVAGEHNVDGANQSHRETAVAGHADGCASVRLFLEVAPDQVLIFERSIETKGVASYQVNGQPLSSEEYADKLAEHSILVKARNFLVFQNEVEDIATKSGKALSALFEEISGSAELRNEYDSALAEVRKAEQRLHLCAQKKRGLLAEKKQCRAHCDEAERYNQLQQQIAKIRKLRVLFQLFHLKKDDSEAEESTQGLERELEALRARRVTIASDLEDQKRALASMRREQAALEKRRQALELSLEKNLIQQAAKRSEARAAEKRLSMEQKALDNLRTNRTRSREEIHALEKALAEVGEALRALNEEEEQALAELQAAHGVDSSAVRRLRDEAVASTASMREMLTTAERATAALRAMHKTEAQKLAALERRFRELEIDRDRLSMQIEKIRAKIQDAERNLEEARIADQKARRRSSEQAQKREALERAAQQYRERLLELRCARMESERERRFHETLDQIMRLFPGARGRIVDICRPVQRRYEEAVSVILGKLGDAIVVDDERTASECIAYLKQQRAGTATFLPLAEIRPAPIDESLRGIGGTVRLAIDVLEFDKSFFPAIQYVVGNALVCDSLDEARHVAYGGSQVSRICTIDGTLIHRSGFITGGAESDQGASRTLWENEQAVSLKRELDEVLLELAKLGPVDSAQERNEAEQAHEVLLSTQRHLEYLRHELQQNEERAVKVSSQLNALHEQVSKAKVSEEQCRHQLEQGVANVSQIKERIERAEREILGDISPQSIHRNEEFRERRLALTSQQAKLRARLEYEYAREAETSEQDLVERVQKATAARAELDTQIERLEREQETLEHSIREALQQQEHIQQQLAKIEEALEKMREEEKQLAEDISSKENALNTHRANKEDIAERLRALETACRIDQIDVRAPATAAEAGRGQGRGAGHSSDRARARTRTRGPSGAQSEDPVLFAEDLDMSLLSEEHRHARSHSERMAIESSLNEQEQSLVAELERMAPNLRITQQLDDIQQRLDLVATEQEVARGALAEANRRWLNARDERTRRFRECFDHVAVSIDGVFKELTRSEVHPVGGSASISLESASEPYLGGIRFSVMLPAKRFREVDQLSGGERSLAALALVFALRDFQKCPFLIMDEIDAALDPANLSRVATYIRGRSVQSHPFQTIVISLKDQFFEFANALVGVYRNPLEGHCSRMLTLDLDATVAATNTADAKETPADSSPS